jgi:hypothetical protein
MVQTPLVVAFEGMVGLRIVKPGSRSRPSPQFPALDPGPDPVASPFQVGLVDQSLVIATNQESSGGFSKQSLVFAEHLVLNSPGRRRTACSVAFIEIERIVEVELSRLVPGDMIGLGVLHPLEALRVSVDDLEAMLDLGHPEIQVGHLPCEMITPERDEFRELIGQDLGDFGSVRQD